MTKSKIFPSSQLSLRPATIQLALATMFCITSFAQTNGLSFRPLDADYSAALDRIIMISTAPNQLHIYDAATQNESTVTLAKAPLSISLSADGRYAAVAHDGFISYVNLQSAAVEKTLASSEQIESAKFPNARLAPGDSKCGKFWSSPDASRLYDGCAAVFNGTSSVNKRYLTTIQGVNGIRSLAESEAINTVALISNAASDNTVHLFDSTYLKPTGRLQLSKNAQGRWVFFNKAADSIYVITEFARLGFGVTTFPTADPMACGASFSTAATSVISSGSFGTVNIAADESCRFQVTSDSPWLEVVAGGISNGNSSLTYLARPNAGVSARTGTLTVGGISIVVRQDAESSSTSLRRIAYSIVDASYDKSLDRVVFVSTNPDELHIYDPITDTDQSISLAIKPMSLSVRSGGGYAAVGHDGWISYVNLRTLAVERVIETGIDAKATVLSDYGNVYLFSSRTASKVFSLDLSSGRIQPSSAVYSGRVPKLRPAGNSFYTASKQAAGCSDLWITEDGTKLLTSCGQVYRTPEDAGNEAQYIGSLSAAAQITSASNSASNKTTAVIAGASADTEVQIYDDELLSVKASLQLPIFFVGSAQFSGHGEYLFWNAAGDKLFVVERADASSGLQSPYGVAVVVASDPLAKASYTVATHTRQSKPVTRNDGCTYGLGTSSVNVGPAASSAFLSVLATAGCAWTETSNNSWLQPGSGSGTGNGVIRYFVQANVSTAARTGTFTIAGLTFTVNQAGWISGKVGAYSAGLWVQDLNGNFQWDGTTIDRLTYWSLGRPGEIPVYGDWNGDGKTKIGLYIDGTWQLDFNGNGVWDGPVIDKLIYFGGPGYLPFVGDWNGSGTSKIAVHQNGTWLIDFNGNFDWDGPATDKLIYFGGPGYEPVLGDWSATGSTKIGVHQNGTWLLDYNGNFAWDGADTDKLLFFGGPGYTPVVGDWQGFGATAIGAHQNGTWLLDFNGNFGWDGAGTDKLIFFGGPGYTPMVGDWSGTGTSKVGAYKDGQWVLDVNGNFTWDPPTDKVIFFGGAGQMPIVGKW